MCFFASVDEHFDVLESSIGPCQFCKRRGTVALLEKSSKTYLWGLIPTPATVKRIARCKKCKKQVASAYYYNSSSLSREMKEESPGGHDETAPMILGTPAWQSGLVAILVHVPYYYTTVYSYGFDCNSEMACNYEVAFLYHGRNNLSVSVMHAFHNESWSLCTDFLPGQVKKQTFLDLLIMREHVPIQYREYSYSYSLWFRLV